MKAHEPHAICRFCGAIARPVPGPERGRDRWVLRCTNPQCESLSIFVGPDAASCDGVQRQARGAVVQ